ncbi:MAG: acetyltransferase [Candidatus Lokiarchaeota archaeon]|nr:acetyltransferase [Candidatus Lokiarchaeota archaeon]
MKKLVIIGAGGFGKQTSEIVNRLISQGEQIQLKGFLDSNKSLHNQKINDIRVLGDIDWINSEDPNEKNYFVCSIADPATREKVVIEARKLKYIPYTLVDPSVIQGYGVKIGEGSIICPGVILTSNISINSYVIINRLCSIGHDVNISDFCTINPLTAIGGYVHLKKSVLIGAHSSILQKLSVGKNSVIGAGASVISDVPESVLVVGVPGKIKKEIFKKQLFSR